MAAGKLSRTARKRLDRINDHLESGSLGINKITTEVLEDLVGRAAISSTPDGYSSSTRLGDGGRGSSDTTSTEATVLAREKPIRDELSKRVKHIESLITFIDVAQAEIHLNIGEIYRVEEEKKKRVVSTPCLICDATAEKAGYCKADYDNWDNYGRPDRLRWEMYKKDTTSIDGVLMVPECPPPSAGRTARRGPYKVKPVVQDLTNE